MNSNTKDSFQGQLDLNYKLKPVFHIYESIMMFGLEHPISLNFNSLQ